MVNNYALHNIETLRFWCRKVLPLVYDDSLSYYEVLCKVAAKLNEVIENENTQNETITEGATQLSNLANALADEIERAVAKEGDLQTALTALENAAEKIANKTNVVNADSTNEQYPSAKAVYEAMRNMPSGDNVYIATLTDTYEDVLAQVEAGKAVFFEFKQIDDDKLTYAIQAPLTQIYNVNNPPTMEFATISYLTGSVKMYYGELRKSTGWTSITAIWLEKTYSTNFKITGRTRINISVYGDYNNDNQIITGWHRIASEGDGTFVVDGSFNEQDLAIKGASMLITHSIETTGLLTASGTGYDPNGNAVLWTDLPQKINIPITITDTMEIIYNT